jgi:hypothetical protein
VERLERLEHVLSTITKHEHAHGICPHHDHVLSPLPLSFLTSRTRLHEHVPAPTPPTVIFDFLIGQSDRPSFNI